eukprot:TRINITY_DN28822_c0_g2_i1.p1 TRINITY_DN28822_c0_g2~~TRINITY_DN28822_c0_g2_i1.p1  ORF type:complete len:127 (+),score=51.17 TRINITY_DN28822_c0_g2_i1:12-392(+)
MFRLCCCICRAIQWLCFFMFSFFFSMLSYFILVISFFFFLMIRRPPRSTQSRSSAASDVYKRQYYDLEHITENYRRTKDFFNTTTVHASGTPWQFTYAKRDIPYSCLLYTSPSPRDRTRSRMPSSA